MDTNELKQRQHFILIRTLLVVTALALLVYIACLFIQKISRKYFNYRMGKRLEKEDVRIIN